VSFDGLNQGSNFGEYLEGSPWASKKQKYRAFQEELYNGIPDVTLWRVLRKRLHLKEYKIYIVQSVEQRIVCTPLSVNVFVTLATE
jgi:hypothetical protein